MIKLVAIDLDGTLFDKEKKISDDNKKAIQKAREMGVYVVIATGRPISGAMAVLNELGLTTENDYAIIYNGAKIFNVGTKETIFTSAIDGKAVKGLYEESKRLNVNIHAFRKNEELITPKHNPYTDVEATINKITDVIADFDAINDDEEFLKCMLVDCDEAVTRCMTEVDPKYYTEYSMVRSAKIFLEFLNKNSDKGQALQALCNHLNIDIADAMAIGDAGNDLPMLLCAGLGVAMENAFPEVKEKIKTYTASNVESGVARAIEKYILSNKNCE